MVRAAAILHDIGILEAERKHGSSNARYQEEYGPPLARTILEKLCPNAETVDHVCTIIGSHHRGNTIDTTEFRIVWDADWLVNLAEQAEAMAPEELAAWVERVFRTGRGLELARMKYLAPP